MSGPVGHKTSAIAIPHTFHLIVNLQEEVVFHSHLIP